MRTFFSLIFALVLSIVAVSCGGGADDAADGPVDEPAGDGQVDGDVVDNGSNDASNGPVGDEDADDAADAVSDEVDTVRVPPTLKPGSSPALGELASEVQDLGAECDDALAPIRALYDVYPSGLEMTGDDVDVFNAALQDAFGACDGDDWAAFQQLELAGWMNAAPSK